MTDYKYNYNWIPDAKAQRERVAAEDRPKARPKGIASKPDVEGDAGDEPGFYEKMLDKLLGSFSSDEEGDKKLSDKSPDREDTQTSYEDMFGGLSQETIDAVAQSQQKRMGKEVDIEEEAKLSAGLVAQERKAAGITQSLIPEDKKNADTENSSSGGIMSKSSADGVQPSDGKAPFEVPKYIVYNNVDQMSDLEILARTIEAEAGGEAYEGKIAVGAVIANRASSGSYGSSGGIKGVILKPSQFSPWNKYTKAAKGAQGKDMMKLKASDDAYIAANAILSGNYTDPTNGSTHYVNESKAEGQKWIKIMKDRKKGTIMLGKHLFGNADNNRVYDGKAWVSTREVKP